MLNTPKNYRLTMFRGMTLKIFQLPSWETSCFLKVIMCQPRPFLSNFLTFRASPAYPSYKLHSYKTSSTV